MTRSIKVLIVGLAMAGVAATATAASPNSVDVNQVMVRFGDLNLQKESGAVALLGRLTNAANKVCDVTPSPAYIRPRTSFIACREAALQDAVVTVDHPMLTAMYQSTRGGSQVKLASR